MSALQNHLLERLREQIETSAFAGTDAGRQFCEAVDRWRSGCSIDQAFGLKLRPGQRSLRTRAAHEQIDDLLRHAAASPRFENLPIAAIARKISRELTNYASTAWLREKKCGECPPRRVGSIYEIFWNLLRIRDKPLTARTIRRILARKSAGHELAVFMANQPAESPDATVTDSRICP